MIRVLVWSKSAVVRAGLEAMVRAESDLELVGSGVHSADLWAAVRESGPDVVVLDAESPPRSPALPRSDVELPAIVALVGAPHRTQLHRLLKGGIRAILLRDSGAGEIDAAIRAAAQGLAVVSPEVLDSLAPLPHEASFDDDVTTGEPLTARETEVLAMLAEGAGNKEIAVRLHLSEHTVKFHVSSILNKLGASTRTEAVARGYREGLITM